VFGREICRQSPPSPLSPVRSPVWSPHAPPPAQASSFLGLAVLFLFRTALTRKARFGQPESMSPSRSCYHLDYASSYRCLQLMVRPLIPGKRGRENRRYMVLFGYEIDAASSCGVLTLEGDTNFNTTPSPRDVFIPR
jgi:hypothetical protein